MLNADGILGEFEQAWQYAYEDGIVSTNLGNYEGHVFGAVTKNKQIAERIYRDSRQIVRITVTVADPPPHEDLRQLDLIDDAT